MNLAQHGAFKKKHYKRQISQRISHSKEQVISNSAHVAVLKEIIQAFRISISLLCFSVNNFILPEHVRLPASWLEGRPRSCWCEKKPQVGLSLSIISARSSLGGSAATRMRSQHKDRKSYTLPLCYRGRAPLRPLHSHFLPSDVCSQYMQADVYMSQGSQLKASPWLGSTW